MIKIDDHILRELLLEDREKGRLLSKVSKQFVDLCLGAKAASEYGELMSEFAKVLAKRRGTTRPRWTNKFIQMINALRDYESLLYSIHGYRDHIAHAVRVCLLGYHLMMRPPLRRFFQHSLEDYQTRWLLSSLFHDICVPLDRLSDIQAKVSGMMKSYSGIAFEEHVSFKLSENIYPKIRQLFDQTEVDFCIRFIENASKGKHGALAGVVMLDTFFGYLDDPTLKDIVAAISLHDATCSVSFGDKPLAGLLVISDELQEWDRPFFDRSAQQKVLKLDFIDLGLSESSIATRLDYTIASSINGYIAIEIDEVENFEKKRRTLSRFTFPFDLTFSACDRKGKELRYEQSAK